MKLLSVPVRQLSNATLRLFYNTYQGEEPQGHQTIITSVTLGMTRLFKITIIITLCLNLNFLIQLRLTIQKPL